MNKDHLVYILDEQISVGFTGKVNVQSSLNKQLLGHITLSDGSIIDCTYKGAGSLKAFYNLCIDEFENFPLTYIVEPELVDLTKKSIHYPYSVLKRKIAEVVENFRASKANKPPGNLKILIKHEFIDSGERIDETEYDLLSTLSDFNKVDDVYANSTLLDYEITNALVSLRKKNALKVIKEKNQ